MKNNIIASIVTYNPSIERLKKNIISLSKQVTKIVIVDNGSNDFNKIRNEIENIFSNLGYDNYHIIINYENVGIAEALNQALKFAKSEGFEWILTMDQDSICEDTMIDKFKEYLKNSSDRNIIILSPRIIDENIDINYTPNIKYSDTDVVITSGSLTNIRYALDIGGYNSELFIDYVDNEFCLRARSQGYRIVKINCAHLYHELGNCKEHNIGKIRVISTNHSALRRYYLFRNSIYVNKKYIFEFLNWTLRDIVRKFKILIVILLFEEEKKEKFKYSMLGIKDGIINKLGKLN